MAKRRAYTDGHMLGASPMTPKGGSRTPVESEQPQGPVVESPDTFRRRVTPVVGMPERRPTTLQEILAMLNGAQ